MRTLHPFTEILDATGAHLTPDATPSGWYIRTAAELQVRLDDFPDGLICRVAPGADPDVVQLGIGPATSTLCNALYSPRQDEALVFSADNLAISAGDDGTFTVACSGPLCITRLASYLRIHRNLPWFTPLDRHVFRRAPSGWCSWYEYYLAITEEEITHNTDWLAEHLQPYGCDWVQIDDGWQGIGKGYGSNRDWFVTCTDDFPHGMRWLADYIRKKGFRPGLWLIPITQSDSTLFATHPELFARRDDGTSAGEILWPVPNVLPPDDDGKWVTWPGRYYLDPTSPATASYLRRLFTMICDDWGYDYIKIDAQGGMCDEYQRYRRLLHDPSLDGPRTMRTATQIMREVMGPDRFLLNCLCDFTSAGICQGIRIGGDIDLRTGWEGLQPAISSTMHWLWLNTIAFYTDPDAVCVREPLTYALAFLWVTLVGITGQLLMASDIMYNLHPDRVKLLQWIFPVADIHPMELYPLDTNRQPGIFDMKVRVPHLPAWDVVALFNWSPTEIQTVALTPTRLGLCGESWICLDAWSGELLHVGDGQLTVEIPATACRVVSYWPALGRPQVVGSNRHLTQGADDLATVAWDPQTLCLAGASHVVGKAPYRLRIYVPDGFIVTTPQVTQHGPIVEIILERNENTLVSWEIAFGMK